MKKIYTLLSVLTLTSTVFGQRVADVPSKVLEQTAIAKPSFNTFVVDRPVNTGKSKSFINKDFGDTLWSESFTSSPFDTIGALWTVSDPNNNVWVWTDDDSLNTTGTAGFTNTNAIYSSARVANDTAGGYLLLNADGYNANGGSIEMDSYFQTDTIALDTSLHHDSTAIILTLEHKFRFCCSNTGEYFVAVSTDPSFPAGNNTKEWNLLDRGNNTNSPDPSTRSFNISEIAVGAPHIFVRVHVVGYTNYYAMVGGISINMAQDYDKAVSINNEVNFFNHDRGNPDDIVGGGNYTEIPVEVTQIEGWVRASSKVMVTSMCGSDMTDVKLSVTGTGPETYSGESLTGIVLEAGADSVFLYDTLANLDPAWDLTNAPVGEYNINHIVTHAEVDGNPDNDTVIDYQFNINDTRLFARDYGVLTEGIDYRSYVDNADKIGLTYVLPPTSETDLLVNAVQVFVVASDTAGEISLQGHIDEYGATVNELASSEPTQLTSSGWVTLRLDQPYEIPSTGPFRFIANVKLFASVGNEDLPCFVGADVLSQHGRNHRQGLIRVTNGNWGLASVALPMIRLEMIHIDSVLSVEELSEDVSFSVYPNPSNGNFRLNLETTSLENLTVSVNNVLGQTVMSRNITVSGKITENISLTDFDKGMYFLTVQDETQQRKTIKLIVE